MGGLEEVERRGAHRTVTMEERRAPVRRPRSAKEVTKRILIYPRETIKSPWPEGLYVSLLTFVEKVGSKPCMARSRSQNRLRL